MRKQSHAKKTAGASNEEPRLDISSMIDVSFLLLIFFLVTSTLEPRDADLGLTLPTPNGTSIQFDGEEVPVIEIDAAGAIFFGGEAVEPAGDVNFLPNLKDRLITYVRMTKVLGQDSPMVQLKADDSAVGQRFIDVMNCLAAVGIDKVALEKEWTRK